ncbi:phage holin family protein [Streptococcus sp. GS001]|jgi:toxin secretion/phage lysis holin|uniref:phage holin family protein n=1 Tax=Streptococcus sp. GS001 TaxID=2766953 RepID=UPI001F20A1F7|nr:phage holin family protein [Streptococcus sp. GS001]MCF4964667.1 phage holin family protein [Streptococcus sp. GS001]
MYQEPDGIFGIFEVVREFYDHGIDEHMIVFLFMAIVALDIVLGVSRAWAYHEFSSRKWRKGLVSHTAIILIVAIGYPFTLYMNLGPVVDAFIVAMMAAYGSSILASLSALGVEIPGLDHLIKQNIDHNKFQLKEGLEEPSKLIKKRRKDNESNHRNRS